MSDGLSESRREEAAFKRIQLALNQLCDALDDVHDRAFGLPLDSILQMCQALKPYGVVVLTRHEVPKHLASITSPLPRKEAENMAHKHTIRFTPSVNVHVAKEELTELLLHVAGIGVALDTNDGDHG